MPTEPVPPPDFDQPSPEPANALGEGAANAGEPESVRAQVRAQAQRQRSSAEFWSSIFASVDGRREMWGILKDLGTFDIPAGVAANGSYDPSLTAYFNSRKDAGQALFLTWMAYDRDGVMQMLAEHQPRVLDVSKTVAAVKPRRRSNKNPTA